MRRFRVVIEKLNLILIKKIMTLQLLRTSQYSLNQVRFYIFYGGLDNEFQVGKQHIDKSKWKFQMSTT
ncbi:unnamed protein product [Paramecium octaurelia]|uniref:Uncharacterized protein n=1 Tax=Paramecium octaurelia TaxID=43137 RepID=A0A8S1WD66_PAROT|nr:unnamed protein product [Paramecium octaurelia]